VILVAVLLLVVLIGFLLAHGSGLP